MSKSLVGKTFGKLKVLSYFETNSKQGSFWICECACGKQTTVNTGSLNAGRTKSCGSTECKERPRADYSGQVFNHVKVLHEYDRTAKLQKSGKKQYRVKWFCECLLCSKKFISRIDSILIGRTKSCGCYSRYKPKLSDKDRKNRASWLWLSVEKKWRKEVLSKQKRVCFVCKQQVKFLHAHHINSFTHFPKSRYDVSNGIGLCSACHVSYHNWHRKLGHTYSTKKLWTKWLNIINKGRKQNE